MKNRNRPGWMCFPAEVMRVVGTAMIVAGALLIVLFVPARFWMALIGAVLLATGVCIRMNA